MKKSQADKEGRNDHTATRGGELSCLFQSLASRLPKEHPSHQLLESIAEALSDALETESVARLQTVQDVPQVGPALRL